MAATKVATTVVVGRMAVAEKALATVAMEGASWEVVEGE